MSIFFGMNTTILIGLLFVIFCNYNPKTCYYEPKWMALIMCVFAFLSWQVALVAPYTLALLFLYCGCSATYYAFHPFHNHFTNHPMMKNINLSQVTLKHSLAVMALMSIFIFINETFINHFLEAAPFILLLASLMVFIPMNRTVKIREQVKKMKTYGFSGNPSTQGTFLSLMAAISLVNVHVYTYPILVIAFLAVVRTKTSSGLGGFVAAMFAYFIWFYPIFTIIFAVVLAGILLVVNKRYYGGKLFYLSQRDHIIKDSFNFLWSQCSKWMGIGSGSYAYCFPLEQVKRKQQDLAVWMHSDILQFVLEGGIIGTALLLITLITLSPIILAHPALCAFVAAYFVNACVNFPSHLGDTAFLIILMLKYTCVSA